MSLETKKTKTEEVTVEIINVICLLVLLYTAWKSVPTSVFSES